MEALTISSNLSSSKKPNFNLRIKTPSERFDEMIRIRPVLPIIRFNKLFSQTARKNQHSISLSLIQQLEVQGIEDLKPDIITLTIAINCFCNLNKVSFAFSVLGKIFKLGLQPDSATFTALIRGLCLGGRVSEALAFLDVAVNNGFQPNIITYGTLVKGLCNIGKTDSALSVLQHIHQSGSCDRDVVVIYSTIIDSLCKEKELKEGLKLFRDMTDKGIKPDLVTYAPLIHGYCISGHLNEATDLLCEMIRAEITPDMLIFRIWIDRLGKEGKSQEADEVLRILTKEGVELNAFTCDALIDTYCVLGKPDEAGKVLQVMKARSFEPVTEFYNTLINGYCKIKRFGEALPLLAEMSSFGLNLNTVTYSILVDGLRDTCGPLDVADLMQSHCQGHYVEHSYNTIISVLCKATKMKEAFELMTQMKEKRCLPNVRVYNKIVRRFLFYMDIPNAIKILEKMTESSCGVDDITIELMVQLSTNDVLDLPSKELLKGFLGISSKQEPLI